MFSGIIEATAAVTLNQKDGSGRHLAIRLPENFRRIAKGESIAVNGVCLTVTGCKSKIAEFYCQKETLAVTHLGRLRKTQRVNLERALRLGARISGHLVQGHVDFLTQIVRKETFQGSWRFWCERPRRDHLMVLKGSIALDGISLTLSRLTPSRFAVDIIPHTYHHTNISGWRKGTEINVETDMIGKYATEWMKVYGSRT